MWEVFCSVGSVLDSGKCFGSSSVFWILGSVLDSGKCFGFWEVFWILGSVLDSGKCFVVFCSVGSVFGFSQLF